MNEYPYNYPGYPAGMKYPWKYPLPSEKERDLRWKTIKAAMRRYGLDCLLVCGPSGFMSTPTNHINYISNYMPFFNPGTYVVFPLEGDPQLGVSNSIGPQFLHCASETSWIMEIVGNLKPIEDVISKIKQLKLEKARIGIVGYRAGAFPASANDVLRKTFPAAKFEDASNAFFEAMNEVSRTSEEELAFLKKTCRIHDLTVRAVAEAMKPGVSEKELWSVSEKIIVDNGGWYPHFILVTSGPRPTFPRAPASHNQLKTGDLIIFETNVIYGGISSQICYTLSLGHPEKKIEKMYDLVEELYEYSLAEHGKHKTFGEVEQSLVDRIHAEGYEPMTPQIHIYNQSVDMPEGSPAQPGDYFTVHPNFCTKDYTAGAKMGDTIRIEKNGSVQRLQKTPVKLHIIKS